MKMFLNPFSSAAAILACVALATTPNAHGQVRPTHRTEIPNLDVRTTAAASGEFATQRAVGLRSLQRQLPGAVISLDPVLGTPSFIRARNGFLTGPDGSGGGVSAQRAQSYGVGDPYRAVRGFLDEHAALFGHSAQVLAGATIRRESVTAHNGLRTVVWQQQHAGLPVFGSVLIGNISSRGELVTLSSQFLPDPDLSAAGVTPAQATISLEQAIISASANLGDTIVGNEITSQGQAPGNSAYQKLLVRESTAYAQLVWLPMNRSSLRLAWELHVQSLITRERFRILVDAQTGAVIIRNCLTDYISDATYNVYTSDSPSPFSPGWPTANNGQPPLTNRVMVTTPALDVTASPNGWINDGDNEPQGNNTEVVVDRDFNQQADGPRPQGNPNRVFDFPLDLNQAPIDYTNASVVQLFYLINVYHDRLYQLGFTESFGNFQNNNFGRGGLGNDRIIAYVQSGADVGVANNAAFGTPPDGISGEMYQFIFNQPNPDRDSALDADVVFHEASHGTSQRLVGGGVLISALQTDGMGEGWGDFIGLSLLSEPGDDPDAVYAAGGYLTFQFFGLGANYYFGIRHFPYTTDMSKNPFTFKDIDPGQISAHPGVPRSPIYPFNSLEADEVHHQGEVWCVTLWDVRANLIRKHGFAGNQLMLQLVIDGMKLGPANPTFLEARDAILLADQVNNSGLNVGEIWAGFAKRGMGVSATSPASSTTAGIVEAFDIPGIAILNTFLSGGNGDGDIDINECNELQIVLQNNNPATATGVSVRLSTITPGVAFGSKISDYPDLPTGSAATNLVPLTISTAPNFVCGTPIVVIVTIKSDQATSVVPLTFETGTVGTAVRFDSIVPIAIPDSNPVGTNSPIVVSGIPSAIGKVGVSLYLTHTFDADLTLQLISPDNVTNTLALGVGGGGDNFGATCAPDSLRTTFSDEATTPIASGNPPFIGSFKPAQPLSVFVGKAGTNVNGTWQLRVVDNIGLDVGVLNCWSIYLYPAQCDDGGGSCPGADLTIGMSDAPDPVFIGSNLVYTITVTNLGPSTAKNTVVNQTLPPSVVFVSAIASQGTAVNAGGSVVCNLGNIVFGGTATINVTVLPTLAGIITSSASISSSESEPDPSNNSAVTTTRVNPPTADLSVGLFDAPDPVLVGGTLAYTVSVTNNGPSSVSGIFVTNTLPISVGIQSVTPSQGSATVNGNLVVLNFGSLTNGGRASASINVIPTSVGTIQATARAVGNQADPISQNNTVTANTVVGPASDLAVGISDSPDPVVVRSNWTYAVGVTNFGPSAANNATLAVTLPTGVTLISTNTTIGTISVSGSTVTADLGNMTPGAAAVITIGVNATNSGIYSASAVVSSSSADPNAANNNAGASTTVAPPTVTILPAGATLTAESLAVNGSLDIGETVTLTLRLRNAGNVVNTNLVATLLATNGVTSPSGAQNYGVLTPSGPSVGRSFTFTASGAPGAVVSATLQLQDEASALGLVAFNFTLPVVRAFSNPAAITIPASGAATPYPSTITVSGVTNPIGRVSVTLSNLNHTFADDVDVLLVGPSGQKVILMSDAGNPNGLVNTTVTFDDAGEALPNDGQILSTTYAPADYEIGDTFPGPAPVGPYGTALGAFNGGGANGTWSLFIVDDVDGDLGNVANGWSISLTSVSPVNQVADIAVAGSGSANPVLAGNLLTYSFNVTNRGPNAASAVIFTNVVPAGATLVSAASSQGGVTTNGNTVVVGLGSLSVGSNAVVTVGVVPNAAGSLVNTATAFAEEIDLNTVNNAASVVTTVNLPVADLGISQTVSNSAIIGSNVVITLIVTNQGPLTALSAGISDTLPSGLTFVSATPSMGSATNSGSLVIANFGNLIAGSSATLNIVANAATLGFKTNVATVATSSSDTNGANNSATAVIQIVPPSPNIVPAGATLLTESFSPQNGTIENGETVTVLLALQNSGTANTVNLLAALQPSGGVTLPSGPQSYGVLVAGGAPVSRTFTFTASGTNGGLVIASLSLDDSGSLGTASFVFNLPTTRTFANTNVITIPDHGPATPYPSTVAISGLTGIVSKVNVTLNSVTHAFPDDLDLLLVSPTGQKVVVMSDAGGGHALTNATITLNDSFAPLPDVAQIASGSYGAADYESGDVFPSPAPSSLTSSSALGSFNGIDGNGNWSLYVVDDSNGDPGTIANGWSLELTVVNPVSPFTDVAVAISAAAPNPLYVGLGLTNTITVTNRGSATAADVTLSYNIPAGLVYVSSSGSQGSIGAVGQLVTANVGTLASGAAAQYQVRLTTSAGGIFENTVTAATSTLDLSSQNNSATVNVTVVAPQPPIFSEVVVTNGQLQATLTAQTGLSYVIYASTDLVSWTPISTNLIQGNGTAKFTDSSAPNFDHRFYRAVRVIP